MPVSLRRRRSRIAGGFDVLEAGRRIRAHLDTEAVLRAAAGEIRRALPGTTVTVWLTTGKQPPRFACSTDRSNGDARPTNAVIVCAKKRKTVVGDRAIAVPVIAPQSGLVGVLWCVGREWPAEDEIVVEALATETGFAIETANLYEQAVAERDKSEAILSRVGDAVVVTDPNGRIRELNRVAEQALGVDTREAREFRCDAVLGLRRGEERLDCEAGCPLIVGGTEDQTFGVEVWRSRPDGGKQPLLASVSGVLDADGAVSEVVHSLRDVTRLKEADEAKTMFLATASHELKTPITVIQGFGQTLLGIPDMEPDQRSKALEAMVRRSIQLNGIVDRLLLSSRIEAGRAELHPQRLELPLLLEQQAAGLAGAGGRDIALEIPEGLTPAWADPDAVMTVVDHLLENAIKYSPGGGPITLRAIALDDAVEIAVADEGIGMDDEQAARCFERFWQAESSDVRRFGGTGIGLFIVRSLVESMRGSVRVESRPGRGSTFFVTLPLRGVSDPDERRNGDEALAPPGIGERSITREFMRQLGIPLGRSR